MRHRAFFGGERSPAAARLLEGFLVTDPAYEATYVTLARIHAPAGRRAEALSVLERLLQRNPKHPVGLELLPAIR